MDCKPGKITLGTLNILVAMAVCFIYFKSEFKLCKLGTNRKVHPYDRNTREKLFMGPTASDREAYWEEVRSYYTASVLRPPILHGVQAYDWRGSGFSLPLCRGMDAIADVPATSL